MGDYRTAQQGRTSGSPTIRVLVTGFGPFGEHSVNASWEAVRHLTVLDDLKDVVDLFVEEIPVKYHEVSTVVPDLWKKYQPHLVIHCGVSGLLQASCHVGML
ncbi:putative Pyroglutamyl-peptidase 1, partial [Hypsibius exemplaris]